jgi:trehalose/maltose hydrolase-like predicted phosphorylase
MKRSLALLPIALILSGCPSPSLDATSKPPSLPKPDVAAAAFGTDPWVLKTTDPKANQRNHAIYLSNGVVGAPFDADGGLGMKFFAGGYDDSENLAPMMYGSPVVAFTPKPGEPYEQSLDLKRGVLTTTFGGHTVTTFVADKSVLAAESIVTDTDGKTPGLATTLAAHEAAWAKRWEGRDILIEGDPEAQQLVHKLMFDLLQSVSPSGSFSIAPEALSGNFYKGHIFWDAEVWMFPALLAQHPDLAKTMLEYRFSHLEQAKALAAKQHCSGADFPWESARSGNETAPSGFSEGRHVTAGVGWAAWQYWLATNDRAWLAARGWPLLSNIANYFSTKAKKNPSGSFDIGPVTGPDELHLGVMNNAYTNAMARNCLIAATEAAQLLGKKANPQWTVVAKSIAIPKNADGVVLRCDGDDGKATKQADGELLLWPAQAPEADAKTFDFHKKRPIKNGPAMTDSVHALISARLGRTEEAEQEFRESYRPFVRGPFLLFSEKRSLDRCVFTTACGGVLQSVLYGFGALDRNHWDQIEKAPIALPKGWKKLEIQGVVHSGKRYKLTVTPEKRTLTPM